MSVRIIVDSSTDVRESYRAKIQFVPLTVRFGETEYYDGVDLSKKEFYEKLVESDALPTTSQSSHFLPSCRVLTRAPRWRQTGTRIFM